MEQLDSAVLLEVNASPPQGKNVKIMQIKNIADEKDSYSVRFFFINDLTSPKKRLDLGLYKNSFWSVIFIGGVFYAQG